MTDNKYTNIERDYVEGTAVERLRSRATYNHGTMGELPMFHRFVVLETIFDPTTIDDSKVAYFEHVLGVSNTQYAKVLPRNSIVARRILDGKASASEPALFLFPFFPSTLAFPCQPGEHVWVMFENPSGKKTDMGFWFCRITEPGFVEDVNHTHSPRANDAAFSPGTKESYEGNVAPKYEFRNGRPTTREGERYTIAETAVIPGNEDEYEKLLTSTDASKLRVLESVPRYRKRPGDVAIEGSNNSLIVLGRDRVGAVASYLPSQGSSGVKLDGIPATDDQKPGAAAIDIVVGRGQTQRTGGVEVENSLGKKEIGKSKTELSDHEGDPDFSTDRSRIYVSQRTKVDTNFGIGNFNVELGRGQFQGKASFGGEERSRIHDSDSGDGAIVAKSDKIRIIARSDVEILVTGHLERDANGHIVQSENSDDYAAVVLKANGDIIFRPSKKGYIKLGGDDAKYPLVVGDLPAVPVDGVVTGPPLITTMGGQFAGSKQSGENDSATALSPGQAKFSAKVLVK